MISDLDEIPNLESVNFSNYNEKIIVFNQRLFFYKLNFGAKISSWHGTRACQKKFLKSPQWLRNLKTQKDISFIDWINCCSQACMKEISKLLIMVGGILLG